MKLDVELQAQRRNLLEADLDELEGLVKEESRKQAEQLQSGVLSPVASEQTVMDLKNQDAAARHPDGQRRRVVLLHMHESSKFPEFEPIGGTALENKRRYARRWGYEMATHLSSGAEGLLKEMPDGSFEPYPEWSTDKDRPYNFQKLKLASAACVGRPDDTWVLWTDADALIINQSIPVAALADDNFDLVMARDWLTINSGVFFLKCSAWARDFLQRAYNAREHDNNWQLGPDQAAILQALEAPGSAEKVKYVAKHACNVYPEEYRPGDYIVHLAGKLYAAGMKGCLALTRQFDALSILDSLPHIDSFFNDKHLLTLPGNQFKDGFENLPELELARPLIDISYPDRYWHIRRMFPHLQDWYDHYDPDAVAERERWTELNRGEL
ncbi:hypothetical protein KFL_002140140 [Klebsormidium nitens]|uniref:Uncharacterized protein n=1 Tax=Klebsormidium nitens TaxID=105231 RepID=A0A1Y1I209_KLENI|nr:hypothetical protein KFL_002140140 [Klebsormidium nitens]|eukprot:GAQ84960.1 hypothetical protein KFL_002140140 [Klebsormidium nitens]